MAAGEHLLSGALGPNDERALSGALGAYYGRSLSGALGAQTSWLVGCAT